MSAMPLPSVHPLATADTATRSLPPAPATGADQKHSFAATLQRHVERPRTDKPDPAAARPATPKDDAPPSSNAATEDQDEARTTDGTGTPAKAEVPADSTVTDAQTTAEQAALFATLPLTVTDAASLMDAAVTGPVQPAIPAPTPTTDLQAPVPTTGKTVTVETAPPVVGIQAMVTTPAISLVAEAIADPATTTTTTITATGTATALDQTSQPEAPATPITTQPAIQAQVAAATVAGEAATVIAAPVAAPGAIQAAVAPTVKKTVALQERDLPQTAPAAGEAKTDPASGEAVTIAADPAPVAAPSIPADTQDASGQPKSTTVPLATPTATTTAMQSTVQQLHAEKLVATSSTKDEPALAPTTDKTFADTITPTAGTTASSTRTLAAEPSPTAAPPGTAPANPMDKVVAQQVSRTLIQTMPNGERMMVVRLTPPELGTVRVEVVEHQGVLSARLHADDDGVRQALEKALPLMRQELRASDAPIRDVQLGDQSRFDQANSNQQGQGGAQGRNGGRHRQEDEPVFSIDGVTTPRERLRSTAAQGLGGRADRTGVNALA